jgi:hypothetical protein
MVGTVNRLSASGESSATSCSLMMEMTDWVTARLPAEARTITRSPILRQKWSLRKIATLSLPALVRVSAANTSPRLSRSATQ